MEINPHIFREYDIRGVAGSDLTAPLFEALGRAFACHLRQTLNLDHPLVAVGRDGRLSSPELATALMAGLVRCGAQVVDVGLTPSPGLYFAAHDLATDGAMMITGSHNPPQDNGMKMVCRGAPFFGEQIQSLRRRLEDGDLPDLSGGSVRQESLLDRYVERLCAGFRPGRAVKVVVDCGNGAAGTVAHALFSRLPGIEAEILFAEVDGTFPNHHPDPTLPETLSALRTHMQDSGAEVGIAFDGDGDRIGALDERGDIIWGDRLLLLFARAMLQERPGAMVIGDVKCSQQLFDEVGKAGGIPLMWKTGHSLVKSKMRETGALLAGEMSGHLFFADRYHGYDDALYAAVRLLELIAAAPSPLSARLADLPPLLATPEMRIPCPDDQKFAVMERVLAAQQAAGGDFSAVDGVRVRSGEGWWLLRVSNTQPVLVARAEGTSDDGLARTLSALEAVLSGEGIALPPWQKA